METKEKKRVALYIRVSTQDQVNRGVGLDVQKNDLIKYVENRSDEYTLDKEKHIYVDGGCSGANDNRPQFKKLLFDVENDEFDVVLVWKIDRFSRKLSDLLKYVEELLDNNVSFISINQNFNLSDSFGRMMLGVLGVIGELERDMIRDRTAGGKLEKARKGFYVGSSTKFGYDTVKEKLGTKLIINEDESIVVKKIFELFVVENKTLGEIADILTNQGYKTKHDLSEKSKKKNKGFWYISTIRGILINEMYIGKYYYGKTYEKKNKKTGITTVHYRKEGDPLLLQLDCERILDDDELFYKARELLEKNKVLKNNKTSYPFTSIITCGKCFRNYKGYKTGKKTLSYRCCGSTGKKLPIEEKCFNPEISNIYLIDVIWKRIEQLIKNPNDFLKEYYKRSSLNNGTLISLENESESIAQKLDSLTKSLTSIYEEIYTIEDSNMKNIKEGIKLKIEKQIELLFVRKEDIKEKIGSINKINNSKKNITKIINKFNLNINKISEGKKVDIIRNYIEKVIVLDDGGVNIIFKFNNFSEGKNFMENSEDG